MKTFECLQFPTLISIAQQEDLDASFSRIRSRVHPSLRQVTTTRHHYAPISIINASIFLSQNRSNWRGTTRQHLLQTFPLLRDGVSIAAGKRDGTARRACEADMQGLDE